MKMDIFQQPRPAAVHGAAHGSFVLAAITAAELSEVATPAQVHGFFVATGRRIAAAEPLEGTNDIAELSARINAVWQSLGWGEAEVAFEADAICVSHRGLPVELADGAHGCWRSLALAVLEGAYDGWFRALGSGAALRTAAAWRGEVIELRHGRSA